MNNGLFGSSHAVNCSGNQLWAARRQNLEPDIIGNGAGRFYKTTGKVKIGLRSRGKRDFNFLVAKLDELVEVNPFLVAVLREVS
jgi:hypothetical protein